MSKQSVNMLCWKTNRGYTYGTIPEIGFHAIVKSEKSFKKEIQKFVSENYIEKEDFFIKPELKMYNVAVSLAYHEEKKTYILPQQVEMKVAAYYGKNEYGYHFHCFLPYMGIDFLFFEQEQLKYLISQQVQQRLGNVMPEEALSYIMKENPKIMEVHISLKKDAKVGIEKPNYGIIPEFADLEPIKLFRKNISFNLSTAYEREEIIEEALQAIYSERKNILFVGDSGTGKTSIIQDVIKSVSRNQGNIRNAGASSGTLFFDSTKNDEDIPYDDSEDKEDVRIHFWNTNSKRLVSNAKYLGEWQENCERLAEELENWNSYLFVTDFMQLLYTGGETPIDSLAAYLNPFLKEKKFSMIGDLSPGEYEKAFQMLPSFMSLFHIISVKEMDYSKVKKILNYYSSYLNNNYKISVDDSAKETVFALSKKYLHNEKFPGKALRLIVNSARAAHREHIKELDSTYIQKIFSSYSGFPESIIRNDVLIDELNIQEFFFKRIVGQDSVIKKLIEVVNNYKLGIMDSEKPIATLLFAGPTGVGKTASARALSEFFFGQQKKRNPIFRVDMSEYQYPHQMQRLIGENVSNPGKLIQHVRANPFSLILFDEIEKADPSFFDVLLSLMDEGIFSDVSGRDVSFRNCIVIMTTNLGSQSKPSPGFDITQPDYKKAIYDFFRPEFVNRLDYILPFVPLDEKSIRRITYIELAKLQKRDGVSSRNIQLEYKETLIDYLSQKGFHPLYGARPLQRTIEKHVVTTLSRLLANNRDLKDTRILIGYEENEVKIEIKGEDLT
ncbi:MAG: ATP-dependent Clp protease ATP-binding subunit [Leptospiraceae bacterium]|nr:ATP-dependent Clp protease ATP-binding subunit [Leptospiraceae bacterium]